MTALYESDLDVARVTSDLFKQVFRRHAAGVAVIATGGASPTGFTATSLVSLSADPPLLSFNVSHGSSSWPAVERATHLSLHLLAVDQQDVATVFATSGIDRFAALDDWRRGPLGLPVIGGVMAWMAVAVRAKVPAGDSSVVIAEVMHAEHTDSDPLLFHGGRYGALSRPAGVQ
ncbi:flavin reductase (DIM6/NTAB) family NADH-FMN oxidoreductase RutF [Motilibacter peucedani]|uniref:Flavin reductase (DIM6/NTAB) family NADH-FMN oxidoreductase RutF n=1 Tax=Motilibacter peucedani TaxID=598650 RepID=A0A420XJZ3_9ACTN|nr:flavin reductase family protein [Motilibacter peucedani]RKS68454.1 flavin reductase (DIM6/NTAB) family NADH-FMN oxidoreductase RutF [Motilibacter peucedani]